MKRLRNVFLSISNTHYNNVYTIRVGKWFLSPKSIVDVPGSFNYNVTIHMHLLSLALNIATMFDLCNVIFVFLNPVVACIINNETLLSEVFTTHTDIVSVWWIN